MSKKKLTLVIACPILAVAALGLGGYQAWRMTPPAMPETVDDVEVLFASSRYQRLSKAERRPYLEHINEMWGKLENQEDRKRLRAYFKDNPESGQQAMEQGMRTMYKTMILQQDEAQRNLMLDMIINQMESAEGQRRRQEDMAKRGTAEGKKREEEGMRRMMQWMDEGDPQAMGYGSEFFKMLQNRRKERGLPPF